MTKAEKMALAKASGMSRDEIDEKFGVSIESVSSMCSRAKSKAALARFRARQNWYRGNGGQVSQRD